MKNRKSGMLTIFPYRAHRMRKALGGAMRQVGILAAAGLVALDTIVPGFDDDHKKILRIAQGKVFSFFFVTFS